MPKPLTASIPYNTLLHMMLAHQADVAIALRPSNLTIKERLITIRQSHDILRNQLARWGIELVTDPVEVKYGGASPPVTNT